MELRTLKYFLAVARSGSINRASQDLFITQPTISRQMKELEDELGGQIFERSARRRLELTPKGRLLMERAEQIVGLAERTKADLREGRELGGEIAIASGEGRSVKAVTDAAAPFLRENPKVRLCFTSGDADECLSLLDRGICDLALIFTPPDPSRYGVLVLP
ncbi:MAG: LysR family transcriptional regulator, partial [Succinivibrio sp.]